MGVANWNSRYETGVTVIDDQHRALFAALNDLAESFRNGTSQNQVEGHVEALLAYALEHFATEEQFMRERGYPGLEAHQADHQRLAAQAHRLVERYRQGAMVIVDVTIFFADLLAHHIDDVDLAMAEFLRGEDSGPSTRQRENAAPADAGLVARWSSRLETGHGLIDAQHRSLFDAVNRLAEAFRAGHAARQVTESLDFLARYTLEHFQTEESLMREVGYPGLDTHAADHAALVAKVRELQAGLAAGRPLALEVTIFLSEWLSQHIAGADMAFARFLRVRNED